MRFAPFVLLLVGLTSVASVARATGDLNATAHAVSATTIEITWEWMELDPAHPVERPEWIGYDLLRRDPGVCSEWTLLNATPIPRVAGATHGGTWFDEPPNPNTTWEYQLVPVDAVRNPVLMIGGTCEPPCVPHMWESIPTLAGPVTIARVGMDLGWALYLEPCAGSCWYSFYVTGAAADHLRSHQGTGEVFRFYGEEYFGGFEGSALDLDRFEPASCGPVPVRRATWGALKTFAR